MATFPSKMLADKMKALNDDMKSMFGMTPGGYVTGGLTIAHMHDTPVVLTKGGKVLANPEPVIEGVVVFCPKCGPVTIPRHAIYMEMDLKKDFASHGYRVCFRYRFHCDCGDDMIFTWNKFLPLDTLIDGPQGAWLPIGPAF